jgi:hypothetical protein
MAKTLSELIADAAVHGLTDDSFERDAGMCQRFVRQVVQSVEPKRFNKYFTGTANATARRFVKSPYVIIGGGFGVPGDLLYWFGSPRQTAGHAAIRVAGNRIAQNSITDKYDAATGYKGFRAIDTMRVPNVIVRLR